MITISIMDSLRTRNSRKGKQNFKGKYITDQNKNDGKYYKNMAKRKKKLQKLSMK